MRHPLILSILSLAGLIILLGTSSVLRKGPASATATRSETAPPPQPGVLRIGLIPERDLFRQRKAYQALASYLEKKISAPGLRRVELVTTSSYAGILDDFRERQIDVAFAGSLLAVLAADRFDTQVVLKSESVRPSGEALGTYTGILFVRDDSPAHAVDDLAGKRVAGIRTTMGGAVFPLYTLSRMAQPFELIWAGTHEDVIRAVAAGDVQAGAVKSTRLEAYEREHPNVRFRRLAESAAAPDNALVVRPDLDPAMRDLLISTLLGMDADPEGRLVLAGLGMQRYVPCALDEYASLYAMIETLGPRWSSLAIDGAAPRPKTTLPPATRPSNR